LIRINIEIDDQDCLKYIHLSGHAGGGAGGYYIVCAAVTALSRTFGQVIENRIGICSSGNAASEGQFDIRIKDVDTAQREWFRGVSDFFILGIAKLARENPETMTIEYN
jgi:uncharacterized protein YsxB (DUF464 family)